MRGYGRLDRLVLFGAPLALGFLEIFHPTMATSNVQLWLIVHLIQLPLFGLVALAIYVLVYGLTGIAATVSRTGIAVFVVFYTALDSIAGIAGGVLVARAQELPGSQQAIIVSQVSALSADFTAPLAHSKWPIFLVTVVAGIGWVAGLLAAAVALRRSQAPLGAAVLVGLGSIFVVHDAPTAPFAMACLLAGAIWTAASAGGVNDVRARSAAS